MHGVMANPAGSAWSFGGSILTFAFPMLLFVAVAVTLYVLYTKPEFVPGHWVRGAERSVSYTAMPGKPATGHQIPGAPPHAAGPTRAEMAGSADSPVTETPGSAEGEQAKSEDAE